MKRTHDKVDASPQLVCFVRDDVGIPNRGHLAPTFTCLFLFDQTSTPDAEKILALFRAYIKDYDEIINVVLLLILQGRHPRYLTEYDADKVADPLAGSDYEDLFDDENEVLERLVEQTKDIENFGAWKSLPSDDAADVDMECVRVIRFHTKF